ncbi:hypothetical protein FIBSPDRAFT_855510 [Athelia psychrophila]|uniref:Uncharacterized protein n=1 Tax=Athelia psychrophila TaxID=1759441 RepID=A0A166P9U9_9AGAM|nr:hypothetical protein FIBSPDRAFT_855510 [Fibularhizoctonia sp. CBS 109695]
MQPVLFTNHDVPTARLRSAHAAPASPTRADCQLHGDTWLVHDDGVLHSAARPPSSSGSARTDSVRTCARAA